MTKPSIGVIYSPYDLHTNTVREHVEGFSEIADFDFSYIPVTQLPHKKGFGDFDGIINHYSVRLAFPDSLPPKYLSMLDEYSGKKIFFLQDEYDNTENVRKLFDKLQPELVFTCVPNENIDFVYPRNRFTKTIFQSVLTGFAYSPNLVEKYGKSYESRSIDLGYRGRFIGNRYGKLGYDKWWLGESVSEVLSARDDIIFDISSEESNRIYGEDWLIFLGNCKATLASESGSNVFDWDGSLSSINARNPNMPYEVFSRRYLVGREDHKIMNQISPRIFEAAAVGTLLILLEGRYSDILIPEVHYLPLKRDFSNFEEILSILKDERKVNLITRRAYEHLIGSGKYSRTSYFSKIASTMSSIFEGSNVSGRISNHYPSYPVVDGISVLTSKTVWFEKDFALKKFIQKFWRLIPQNLRYRLVRVIRTFSLLSFRR